MEDTAERGASPAISIFLRAEQLASEVDSQDRDQHIKTFIEQRLGELRKDASVETLSALSPPHRGFIHPESRVKALFVSPVGLKINDGDIYYSLFRQFDRYGNNPSWKKMTELRKAQYLIQYAIDGYFGGADVEERNRFYDDRTPDWGSDVQPKDIDLSEMKGGGIAVCTERAGVAQNLLAFLGYDSTFIAGDCTIEEKAGGHAFNVIKTKEGWVIYDPTNPVEVDRGDGSKFFTPASYPISEDQYADLKIGRAHV